MSVARVMLAGGLGLAACSFPRPSEEFTCETTADCDPGRVCDDRGYCVVAGTTPDANGGPDGGGGIDGPIDCAMWNARHFDPCALPAPAPPVVLTAGMYVIDTDTGMLTGPGVSLVLPSMPVASGLVVSIDALTIESGATLRVIGDEDPLIVAAWGAIEVDGLIDASSNLLGGPGAGTDPVECLAHDADDGVSSNNGAGGGGGGGFHGAGGAGGSGDVPGGVGGSAVAVPLLLAGCPGGYGGDGDRDGGEGGDGGGAVQLSARVAITITGRLHAGGEGGEGGTDPGAADADGGGGGGGSGGMLGLEAPSVMVTASAILAANGGGGGQGADIDAGERGHDASISATRAAGGSTGGNMDGDIGGRGSGGAELTGERGGQVGQNGGGGGGGGAGHIVISAGAVLAGVISPAPTTP